MRIRGVAVVSGLFGPPTQVGVERGLAEFRAGRPVLLSAAGQDLLALPVDGMTEAMLVAFRLLSRPVRPFLLVTARRACAIGVEASGPTGIALPDFCGAGVLPNLPTLHGNQLPSISWANRRMSG